MEVCSYDLFLFFLEDKGKNGYGMLFDMQDFNQQISTRLPQNLERVAVGHGERSS